MRAINLFRGMAWLGVIIVFSSLNIRWGTDLDVGKGPPQQWHKAVVGAALLATIAALALSVSGRKGNPPSWLARGIAGACAVFVLVIAWRLRADASSFQADMLEGQGWTWLLAGGGIVGGAVIGTLGLKRAPDKQKNRKRGKKKR